MEKILLFIKHHFSFFWRIIESFNNVLFSEFFYVKMNKVLAEVLAEQTKDIYIYRKLKIGDATDLFNLINSQQGEDLKYFRPHEFDYAAIRKQFNKRSFLMMGVFDNGILIGYFFLRFFVNKKCFVGRLIDSNYRGRGVGLIMNRIMYETAWRLGFRCLSTISRRNSLVMRAHANNPLMVELKNLQNDYLLVEFVRK